MLMVPCLRWPSIAVFLLAWSLSSLCSCTTNAFVPLSLPTNRAQSTSRWTVAAASNAACEFDKSIKYDVAVIGAGVVGVQAALLAASAPYSKQVILIDSKLASGA